MEAMLFIAPIGLAMLATAILLRRIEARSYALGACVPLVLFGLIYLGTGTGIGIGLRTPTQVAEVQRAAIAAPANLSGIST